MDAASQRGIDDIREIRERVVLQPVEGRYKVYILDEAHQLTDAAWNALLKLIEEPPPHLVFVFCTTDLAKVLPTVRSRCQTFVFSRPRLRRARARAAPRRRRRGDRGARRRARADRARRPRLVPRRGLDARPAVRGDGEGRSPCSRCCSSSARSRRRRSSASATWSSTATRPARCTFIEELSEQGQDLGRLVTDLLEHLRHLLLVQHLGDVPESLPVTEETRERLREQANQLAEATVLRLIDLLAVAVEDMRQGGDPRLPLELALVKVTRPGSDLSRESLAYRVEQLEQRAAAHGAGAHTPAPPAVTAPGTSADAPAPAAEPAPRGTARSSSRSSRRPGSAPSCPR